MSIENKIDEVKGAVKENLGKLASDTKTQTEGTTEKVIAKTKEIAEDVKDATANAAEEVKNAAEGAIDGIKNMFNK